MRQNAPYFNKDAMMQNAKCDSKGSPIRALVHFELRMIENDCTAFFNYSLQGRLRRPLARPSGLRHSRRKLLKITDLHTDRQTIENHNYGVTHKRTDYWIL